MGKKYMEETQRNLNLLTNKGFSRQIIRLLQGSVSHQYSGLVFAINLATQGNSNITLVQKENIQDFVSKQKQQLVLSFKKDLIYGGCEEDQIETISKAFEKDLEEITV